MLVLTSLQCQASGKGLTDNLMGCSSNPLGDRCKMTISVTLMINNNVLGCLYDIIPYNGNLVHFIQKSV